MKERRLEMIDGDYRKRHGCKEIEIETEDYVSPSVFFQTYNDFLITMSTVCRGLKLWMM